MPTRLVFPAVPAGAALFFAVLSLAACAAAQSNVMAPEVPSRRLAEDEARWRATAAYQLAQERFAEGDDAGALRAANQAFDAWPNASTAVIRGTILGRLARHRDAFEAFLMALDMDPNVEELVLIRAGLADHGARLEPPMGWLRLQTDAPDTWARLGGRRLKLPRSVGLVAGAHRIVLEPAGQLPEVRDVVVEVGRGRTEQVAR